MATRQANVLSVRFVDSPMGVTIGSIVLVSFDLQGVAYTGGADTVQLGGGGTDSRVATTLTLAQIIAARARDGRTYTIYGVSAVSVAPGNQAAATNGPAIYVQSAAISTGNITCNLFSAITAGSAITTTSGAWERAAAIALVVQASTLSSD